MSDATVIAIVSVTVAGVLGPGLTAWATSRLQRRRLDHELQLHDRDDLRQRLDEVAEALEVLGRLTNERILHLSAKGPGNARVFDATQEAIAHLHATDRLIARLGLRVDQRGDAIGRALDSKEAFRRALEGVSLLSRPGPPSPEVTLPAIWKDQKRGRDASREFIDAGRAALRASS